MPDWYQLDDYIAIVNIEGKEIYLDPGERYCEFGKLKWNHTWTGGVRQTDFSGAELATTPPPVLTDTQIVRKGELRLDPDGSVHGTLRISMTGDEALRWRQEALRTDENATKKRFDEWLRPDLPSGVTAATTELSSLTDSTQPLVVTMDVSGTVGTRTGHRIFVPGDFFEARTAGRFAPAERETPVYMRYPYIMEDQVKLLLPAGLSVQSTPHDAAIPFAPNADFVARYKSVPGAYLYGRRLRLANLLYATKDYPQLRSFFQKVNSQDQDQLVLQATGAAEPGAGTAGRSE